MSNIGRAQQLICGSQNINRMRAEISQIVKMIVGLLPKQQEDILPWMNDEIVRFQSGDMVWVLYVYEESLWIRVRSISFTRTVYNSRTSVQIANYFVREVYEGLDTFVEQMVEKFPALNDNLQPFFEAGEM